MSTPVEPPSCAPLLVEEPPDVEVESSDGSPLVEELLPDDPDSSAVTEALVGMPVENPVSERGPPQAARTHGRRRYQVRREGMTHSL
jgi:hypothetical protein